MASPLPGYLQHEVPVPQAEQGHVVHEAEAKKSVHVPWAHTWFVAQAVPQNPG